MECVHVGKLEVSRFILSHDPFSGVSHQGPEIDLAMMRYYTSQRIKDTLREAEKLGIDTVIGRTDHHVQRILLEYWDEGGTIKWFAQTTQVDGPQEMLVNRAIEGKASACHIDARVMDSLLAQGRIHEILPAVDMIREAGMMVGIAGHNPQVFIWAERNIDVDYYVCSYYNPAPRYDTEEGDEYAVEEIFREEDRRVMTGLIQSLTRPAIHYNVLAGGYNDPSEAFRFAASCMRPSDAVCEGVYTKIVAEELGENVRLMEES
ncbi:MAG: hypothetical protein U9N45_06370, partial [Gemmatimonadota bacterium]|nr:hypothetical protein [Gemmatimonadota bacterium]